jgi:hypothetical protein
MKRVTILLTFRIFINILCATTEKIEDIIYTVQFGNNMTSRAKDSNLNNRTFGRRKTWTTLKKPTIN